MEDGFYPACDEDRSWSCKFSLNTPAQMTESLDLDRGFHSTARRVLRAELHFPGNSDSLYSATTPAALATIPGMGGTAAANRDLRRPRRSDQPARAEFSKSVDEYSSRRWTAQYDNANLVANHSHYRGNFYINANFDIPYFDGSLTVEDYLDWEQEVEEFFVYTNISQEKHVRYVVRKLQGRAKAWWEHLTHVRRHEGRRDVNTWSKMKQLLREQFLPYGYEHEFSSRLQKLQKIGGFLEWRPTNSTKFSPEVIHKNVNVARSRKLQLRKSFYEEEKFNYVCSEISSIGEREDRLEFSNFVFDDEPSNDVYSIRDINVDSDWGSSFSNGYFGDSKHDTEIREKSVNNRNKLAEEICELLLERSEGEEENDDDELDEKKKNISYVKKNIYREIYSNETTSKVGIQSNKRETIQRHFQFEAKSKNEVSFIKNGNASLDNFGEADSETKFEKLDKEEVGKSDEDCSINDLSKSVFDSHEQQQLRKRLWGLVVCPNESPRKIASHIVKISPQSLAAALVRTRNLVLFALAKCYKKEIILVRFYALLKSISIAVFPLILYAFVWYSKLEHKGFNKGLALVGCLLIVKVVESLSQRHWFFDSRKCGMRKRSVVMAALYQKELKISRQGKLRHSTDEIVNYSAVDVYGLGDFPWWFHMAWSFPLQLICSVAILLGIVGKGALPGCPKMLQHFQLQFMVVQDERLRATSEVLNNMKIIKLHSWEENFRNKIELLRGVEFKLLRKTQLTKSCGAALYWISPIVISGVIFAGTAIMRSAPINAGTIFTVLATLRVMLKPVRMLPEGLSVMIQVKVSLDRLDNFLQEDEIKEDYERRSSQQNLIFVAEVNNGVFSWVQSFVALTLRNINLQIKKGQRIDVCGSVYLNGSIAYVSQTSWIQSGTLHDKIWVFDPGGDIMIMTIRGDEDLRTRVEFF